MHCGLWSFRHETGLKNVKIAQSLRKMSTAMRVVLLRMSCANDIPDNIVDSFFLECHSSSMDDLEDWPEIEKAAKEKRRELVLQGALVDERILATGGLTTAVYSLKLLNYLEVAQCPSLTEIHEDIKNLVNLQSLILCRNKLGSIPKVIGSLKSLKVLDLSVNHLAVLPDEITQLAELNTLNVSCNSLRCLPEGLSRCTKLYNLNISKNAITRFPSDFYSDRLDLLSTVIAYDNAIEELSGDVHKLAALKVMMKKRIHVWQFCLNSAFSFLQNN